MKIRQVIFASLCFLGVAGAAHAGFKQQNPVSIDLLNRFAQGSFGSARNSQDGQQSIDCAITSYKRTLSSQVVCNAQNVLGQTVFCTAPASGNLIEAMAALDSDSFLNFTYDATGTCTSITVINGSSFEPKLP